MFTVLGGEKIPNSWATKSKQWGERKALWYLCFPALKNLHPHPQAACYMHRWMAAWPNSKVLCKAKTLPTPGPKIPHKVPNEANFQWQAIRTQATKALAGLSTGCSSWLFQGCSGCQHSASRGNWCHPDLCWQTPKAHPRCPDSSLPPGHEWCWIQWLRGLALLFIPAVRNGGLRWGHLLLLPTALLLQGHFYGVTQEGSFAALLSTTLQIEIFPSSSPRGLISGDRKTEPLQ